MPKETQRQKEHLKVTDKRIFTADGEIREEFRDQITPSDPAAARPVEAQPQQKTDPPQPQQRPDPAADRRRSVAEKASSPGTPFANFIEPLIAQAYMSLGMLPNPYAPQTKPDVAAAKQMIDILTLLHDKTAGNLTPDEDDFLSTHIGELKLAYVKRTKSI
ncbi:MAG TPA: DUF1844 domain-containing protein [Thermoanaerobaculia bacterium]